MQEYIDSLGEDFRCLFLDQDNNLFVNSVNPEIKPHIGNLATPATIDIPEEQRKSFGQFADQAAVFAYLQANVFKRDIDAIPWDNAAFHLTRERLYGRAPNANYLLAIEQPTNLLAQPRFVIVT